jgi:hypothetical protein
MQKRVLYSGLTLRPGCDEVVHGDNVSIVGRVERRGTRSDRKLLLLFATLEFGLPYFRLRVAVLLQLGRHGALGECRRLSRRSSRALTSAMKSGESLGSCTWLLVLSRRL